MNIKLVLLIGTVALFSTVACNKKETKQALSTEELKKEDAKLEEQITLAEDSIYTDWKDIFNTAYFDNPKAYFRENNKFKDWDKNDAKVVRIKFISEKDGTFTNIEVFTDCEIEELNKEAVRLIASIPKAYPALDFEKKPIRTGNNFIDVHFPPKK